MTRGLGALALVLLLGCDQRPRQTPAGDSGGATPDASVDREKALREDPRIAPLLQPCSDPRYYDVDIAQSAVVIERLLDKLEHGQLEPLRRAEEELADIGAPAVPGLTRLVERHYGQQFESGYVENALIVASMMKTPAAHDVLVLGFDHPQSSVQLKAAIGLRMRHARPDDFDHLLARLDQPASLPLQNEVAQALFTADRDRAEDLVLDWVRRDERRALWNAVLPLLSRTRRDATRAACAAVRTTLSDDLDAAWLAAPAAAGGDEAARDWIRERLRGKERAVRLGLCDALSRAGWVDPLVESVQGDPDPEVRILAASELADAPDWSPERRDAVASLLDGATPQERVASLRMLVAKRDPEAVDRALAQLASKTTEPLQAAVDALREPLQEDRALAERAQPVLARRIADEAGAPLRVQGPTIKAIGLLPLPWAADTLVSIAREHLGERMEGLRAHRWILVFAGNTGEEGRARLWELLADEHDPLRRIDYLYAVSSVRTDAARERMLAHVEREGVAPIEVLFCAHRLVNIGPAHLVAPRLKRVLNGMQDKEVRWALSCLLWQWY